MGLDVRKYRRTTTTEMVLLTHDNFREVASWAANKTCPVWYINDVNGSLDPLLEIETTEGLVKAYPGTYVAKDSEGNPYPIASIIVKNNYKEVE